MGQKSKAIRKAEDKVEKAAARYQKMEQKTADWRRRVKDALHLLNPVVYDDSEYLEMVQSETDTLRNLNFQLREEIRLLTAALEEARKMQEFLRQKFINEEQTEEPIEPVQEEQTTEEVNEEEEQE